MNGSDIPTVNTRLGVADRIGHLRVRLAIQRDRYRVRPGLYRVGAPGSGSPVLVTANYKLTFDALRSELKGVDAWILVLDTRGINVWCAAGKGLFGTEELVNRLRDTGLEKVVSHRRIVVPQLGATGVSAHEVKRLSGFRVIYGPVRARDIKIFLDAGMQATVEMRRVTFTLRERIEVTGADLGTALKWLIPIFLALAFLTGDGTTLDALGALLRAAAPVLAGLFAGLVLVPILLPWVPGRAFSLKGAMVGAVVVVAVLALDHSPRSIPHLAGLFLLGTAVSSFFAMQFTGSTPFTSPSGVEWEMRRALPLQVAAVAVAAGIGVVRMFAG